MRKILLSLLIASAAYADTNLSFRRTSGSGIGYNQGYTTLEAFVVPYGDYNYFTFLDLRGHKLDSSKYAANVGFGGRYVWDEANFIGANAYYDYRDSYHANYHQMGLGLEWLNPAWEARLNGYIPLTNNRSHAYGTKFDSFSGNQIYFSDAYEFSLNGLDAELGYYLARLDEVEWYAGVGGYCYTAWGQTAAGPKARLQMRLFNYLSFEVQASYDSIYHTQVEGVFRLTIPFGFDNWAVNTKGNLYNPVERREIIPLHTKRKSFQGINPETLLPYNFVFVNNTNSSAGNGTFENPYPTLLSVQNNSTVGDIIYVYAGDGTDTGMSDGITLQDNQSFFGSGTTQLIDLGSSSYVIPPQTRISPLITSSSNNAIELANGNTVSGFNIRSDLWGIHGGNITNANIQFNNLSGDLVLGGVGIEEANGTIVVNNNKMVGTESGFCQGIGIQTVGSSIALVNVIDNDISVFCDGVNLTSSDSSLMSANVTGNNIYNCGDYCVHFAVNDTSHFQGLVMNNVLRGAGDAGFLAVSESFLELQVLHNRALENIMSGISILTQNNGVIQAAVEHNDLRGNILYGVYAATSGGTEQICLKLNGNSSESGYQLENVSPSIFNLEVPASNNGLIGTSGTITEVPAGTCF